MMKILKLRKASSIIEYMIVILFIAATLVVFRNYIIRGFSGRWKVVGDSFGGSKQYDPKPYSEGGTLECFFFHNATADFWVATRCYEECLRDANGFGNPEDMKDCRGDCSQYKAQYLDCRDPVVSP